MWSFVEILFLRKAERWPIIFTYSFRIQQHQIDYISEIISLIFDRGFTNISDILELYQGWKQNK